MTIYVDVVLMENLMMNYIILLATGLILKLKLKHIRLIQELKYYILSTKILSKVFHPIPYIIFSTHRVFWVHLMIAYAY